MFAPPPLLLSRAELERRKRLSGTTTTTASSSIHSRAHSHSSPASSLRSRSREQSGPSPSSRKGWFFRSGGGNGEKRSGNTASPPPKTATSSPQHPGDRAASRPSPVGGKPMTLSEAFGERPRKAPAPPVRPARRMSEGVGMPGAFPTAPLPATPPQRLVPMEAGVFVGGDEAAAPPPPVPEKSPKRAGLGRGVGGVVVMGGGEMRGQMGVSARRLAKGSERKEARRRSGSFGGKVEKNALPSARRSSAAAVAVRAAVASTADLLLSQPAPPPRRATDGELHTHASVPPPSSRQQSSTRRHKGETLSMLLHDGFFPVREYIYSAANPNISVQVPFPPPPSLRDKALPDTPDSIVPTPTELYQAHVSPVRERRAVVQRQAPARKGGPKRRRRRSPLAPLNVTDAKANGSRLPPAGIEGEMAASRLSAIPEGSTVSENTPPGSASGVSTPLATKIHLRGGSVMTLSPPELTAWQRTCYVPGAIKLPKPTILPRKGSTASMEAWQEVVEQVYQEALNIPRRRSDDQIVDDICDFFDDFCFEELGFEGSILGVLDVKLEEMEDIEEEEGMGDVDGKEIKRFATPPNGTEATPVEKVIAKEIVEHTILLPPVETEETLCARGIARLSQGAPPSPTASSRRASMASRKDSSVLPLLPVPETTMLDLPPTPALPTSSREDVRSRDRPTTAGTRSVDQGFDWDDDVEELDALSAWVAPAALPKKYGMQRNRSARESKNPVTRMRRLVATASAIL